MDPNTQQAAIDLLVAIVLCIKAALGLDDDATTEEMLQEIMRLRRLAGRAN